MINAALDEDSGDNNCPRQLKTYEVLRVNSLRRLGSSLFFTVYSRILRSVLRFPLSSSFVSSSVLCGYSMVAVR